MGTLLLAITSIILSVSIVLNRLTINELNKRVNELEITISEPVSFEEK
jgi:cell division protein FtsL